MGGRGAIMKESENSLTQGIENRGWSHVPFEMSEADRAEYARLANTVISIALDNDKVRDALAFDLFPGKGDAIVRTGMFGIGTARNSADDKVYLHTGYASADRAAATLPRLQQPKVLREFWEANDAMLEATEETMKSSLIRLGAEALNGVLYPDIPYDERFTRNIHLRTVRYVNATEEPVGKEVVSGHSDLGLSTLHLYETHGGWFKGAPYQPKWISSNDTPERRQAVQSMREGLQPIDSEENSAVFFLGANWHTFPYGISSELQQLPACYHAGFKPSPEIEEVSEFATAVTEGRNDRVSTIVFAHPAAKYFLNDMYKPATVPMCRPSY
jgi:hypothetical protein